MAPSRPHAPGGWLSWPFVAVFAAVLALLVGYFAYDTGLRRAGFNRDAAADAEAVFEQRIDELVAENKSLSARIAVLETAAVVDQEAYSQVESQLVELQSKILAQQEDIEFYRGIVNEDDGSLLRIQDFAVRAGRGPRDFELQLVLAQALRTKGQVSGSIRLTVEGQRGGAATRLELDDLGGDAETLAYKFRYFKDLKVPVTLPDDFAPERVQVRVRPRGTGAKTVEEFFVWQVESG